MQETWVRSLGQEDPLAQGLPGPPGAEPLREDQAEAPEPFMALAPGRPLADVHPAPLPARTVTACDTFLVCPGLLE